MYQSDQINEIAAALCKAQGQMESVRKDKKNPHFKSKYASLDAVVEAVGPVLNAHGIAYLQPLESEGERVYLKTIFIHSSGQWISSKVPFSNAKGNVQAFMSELTYLRRGALASLAGVAPDEDDDAESAVRPNAPTNAPKVIGFINAAQLEALEEKLLGDDEAHARIKEVWGGVEKIPASQFEAAYAEANRRFNARKQPRRM